MNYEEIMKGQLVSIQDNGYVIQDESGQEFPNCINITSLKLQIGELIYFITFKDSKSPIIIGTIESNVRDKSIEEKINDNKFNIDNLNDSNNKINDTNEQIKRILNGNEKHIQEIETKLFNNIQQKYEIINDNWYLNGIDTGIRAKGTLFEIKNGNMWIDNEDTGYNIDNSNLENYFKKDEINDKLDTKLNKSNSLNKIYGTNSRGEQTIYDLEGFSNSSIDVDLIVKRVIDKVVPPIWHTFDPNDDPNERFPDTVWELLEEGTYIIAAGENLPAGTKVGTNWKKLTINELPTHTHEQNEHKHAGESHSHGLFTNMTGYDVQRPPSKHERTIGSTNYSWNLVGASNRHTMQPLTDVSQGVKNQIAINKNTGESESFDNRPKSKAMWIWERIE